MIVAFDLDDTLYDELSFVQSGFRAVADAASERWEITPGDALEILLASLKEYGRGRQIDDLLIHLGAHSKANVRSLVNSYRRHHPSISLHNSARETLLHLKPRPLYLVTDGHKIVQDRKIKALGLQEIFEHSFLTNRYGRRFQKPSPHVFNLMLRRERCRPHSVVYIGDNPLKDFCGIRPMGIRTIRIRQGQFKHIDVPAGNDAEIEVDHLDGILEIITTWERQRETTPARSSH